MKDFKHYFENAEEETEESPVENEGDSAEEIAPAVEEPPIENEGEGEESVESSEPIGIKLKDSVFIDASGNLVIQLAGNNKQISPDEYLGKYLPALLEVEKYKKAN